MLSMVVMPTVIPLKELVLVHTLILRAERAQLIRRAHKALEVQINSYSCICHSILFHALKERIVFSSPPPEVIWVSREITTRKPMHAAKIAPVIVVPCKPRAEVHDWSRPLLAVHPKKRVVGN